MKKNFSILLYALIGLVMASLLYRTLQRRAKQKQIAQQMQQLPDFSFYGLHGKPIGRKDVANGKPLCIVYMDPDCHFCDEEIKGILDHIDRFANSQLLFVSPATAERLQQYQDQMGLALHEQILLAHDRDFSFPQYFAAATTPTVIIYGSDGKLLKKYRGQTKIEAILAHLDD